MTRALKSVGVVVLALAAWPLVASNPGERVLIRADKPYTNAKSAVASVGGQVVREFKYVDAIAAEVPQGALAALKAMVGTAAITKDEELSAPRPIGVPTQKGGPQIMADALNVDADAADLLDDAALAAEAARPEAYLVNNTIANVSAQHASGFTGLGVTVALIDSGIRPGFPISRWTDRSSGARTSCSTRSAVRTPRNDGHGTFVAGMVSANVIFTFAITSALRNAVLAECPGCFSNAGIHRSR